MCPYERPQMHEMQAKQDPITRLWCRADGSILMLPTGHKYRAFRWTFGSSNRCGYKQVQLQGKTYKAHQIVCRAFHGLAPEGKPCVDHINRTRDDNRPENLRWASIKENNDNTDRVDQSIARYGVRHCDDKVAYDKAHYEVHREELNAHSKAYRKAHPEKSRAHSRAYYERHKV